MNKKILNETVPTKGWPKDKPWTEKEAAKAIEASSFGLSRNDFSDDGADLKDLKKIWNNLPSSFSTKVKIKKGGN